MSKPLFTKKHYKAIAEVLNDNWKDLQPPESDNHDYYVYEFWEVLGKLMHLFIEDNPKFDWVRFKKQVYKS